MLAIVGGTDSGYEARITANRVKIDPSTGEPLEDHTQPGDYLTVGYSFRIDHDGEQAREWSIERASNYEGEQAAADLAAGLALHADREFCETMVQVKCALDRFGGQVFIRPYIAAETQQVAGYVCQYEHLVRGAAAEPDSQAEAPSAPAPEPVQEPEPEAAAEIEEEAGELLDGAEPLDPSSDRDAIEDEAAELAGAEAS